VNEEITVRKANEAFYAAMENLDIKNMESVWLREPYITCAHAGWPLLEGWGPIMKSWERIFDQTFEMKILINEIRVRVSGDMAWAVVTEHIESRHYEGISAGTVFTTNVFERCGTSWYLVHHHSSPVQRHVDGNADQLQ
jgi:ketosteroid isomerase-like protein